ncbi:MAG: hypothetical protein ACRC0L_03975, partial [Angustibacter sp.]
FNMVSPNRDPDSPKYEWYYVRGSQRVSEGEAVSSDGTFTVPDSDNISDADGGSSVHGGFGSSGRKGGSSGS